MTRVFVSGASGLLGGTLVPYLESKGYDVIVAPTPHSSTPSADLTIGENVRRLLDATQPDLIVNLAALTDVDYCECYPAEAYRVNAGIALNLVRWVESTGSSNCLIQISTDQLYGGHGPHTEHDICPSNYYGYTKSLAEEYVRRVDGVSLRTNFFGKTRRTGRPSISDWIVAAIRGEKNITVFDDVLFSPLSLTTLVEAIELVMRQPAAGVFNLGSRGGMSKADFAYLLAESAGLPTSRLSKGSVAGMGRPAHRPRDMRLDSSAFRAAFGVPPPELADEIWGVGKGYRDETI